VHEWVGSYVVGVLTGVVVMWIGFIALEWERRDRFWEEWERRGR
jgi:hypothetical protein